MCLPQYVYVYQVLDYNVLKFILQNYVISHRIPVISKQKINRN